MITREKTVWVRVTKRNRCPICGKPDFCGVSADGLVCVCMRTESGHPTRNGGWLHRLDQPMAPPPMPAPSRATPPTIDAAALAAKYEADISPEAVARLAGSLGLSPASLRRLNVGWCFASGAWSFPMRDPDGKIIGIRLRAEDGSKFAVAGSHNALFIPFGGQIPDLAQQVLVCEGPTDTAAALDLGVYAVGRPSCSAYVAETVQALTGRDVVIVADHDEPRADGRRPGQEGAIVLAKALTRRARSIKMIEPLAGKDLRQWLQAGCTADLLASVIRNTGYWRP